MNNSEESGSKDVGSESDSEYEEALVYIHFPDLAEANAISSTRGILDEIDIEDVELDHLESSAPEARIAGLKFQGTYLKNLGSQYFFSVDKKNEEKKKETGQEMLDRLKRERELENEAAGSDEDRDDTNTNVEFIGMTNRRLHMSLSGFVDQVADSSTDADTGHSATAIDTTITTTTSSNATSGNKRKWSI
jgi:hypothetical protein